MAEVIPASGDDWREIERRASLPEGHVERALLEILQRLVPVENQVVPVGAAKSATAAAADRVPDAGKLPTASEISQEWLATYREDEARYDLVAFARAILAKWGNRPTPAAAPAGGVTEEEMRRALADSVWALESDCERREVTNFLFNHPRIGPLLHGEGGKRVALAKVPTSGIAGMAKRQSRDPREWLAGWTAARAEVARQQGETV